MYTIQCNHSTPLNALELTLPSFMTYLQSIQRKLHFTRLDAYFGEPNNGQQLPRFGGQFWP